MGSLTGIRFYNTQLRNYAMVLTLRPITSCIHHCLLNREMYHLKSQQRFLRIVQHCDILNFSLANCLNNNSRDFSMTCILAKGKDRGKDKKKSKSQHIDYHEMEQVINVNKLTSQLERAIEIMKDDFAKYLSIRSTVGAIEELPVKFEGKDYTLQELAQISRKPKLIVLNISTFPQAIPDILKSLTKNQMNLNPQQDGTTVYVPIPKVTKEHRESLSKNAKTFYTKCCNNIRDIRNKQVKTVKNKEGLAKDIIFRMENYIDILSNQYVSKAEQLLETKQKELLGDFD